MTDDRTYWESALTAAVPGRSRRIPLPRGIAFHGREHVHLHLPAAAVLANMQEDAAAFEGWLLALRAWCSIPSASLRWDVPEGGGGGHYQRFLYRVQHFARLFPWFAVERRDLLDALRTNGPGDFVFNVARGPATEDVASAAGSEAAMEKALVLPGVLNVLPGAIVDRQFPVGLFDGAVAAGREIFTRGKSAIDLVAWREEDRRFALFELKVGSNKKVGIVSETLFYAMLLQDARQRNAFRFPVNAGERARVRPEVVKRAVRIDAWLLAPALHPLLEGGAVLDLLNAACAEHSDIVRFGALRLHDTNQAAPLVSLARPLPA